MLEQKFVAEEAILRADYSTLLSGTLVLRDELTLPRKSGWSERIAEQFDSLKQFDIIPEEIAFRLRSFTAQAQVGLDVLPPVLKETLKSVKCLRFHPTKPLLLAATSRSYLPDVSCHLIIYSTTDFVPVADIAIQDAWTPADNGIRSISFSSDGDRLYIGMASGNVRIYDFSNDVEPRLLKVLKTSDSCRVTDILPFDSLGVFVVCTVCKESGKRELCRYSTVTFDQIGKNPLESSSNLVDADYKSGQIVFKRNIPEHIALYAIDVPSWKVHQIARFPEGPDRILTAGNGVYMLHEDLRYLDRSNLVRPIEAEQPREGLPLFDNAGELLLFPGNEFVALADRSRQKLHFWATCDLKHLLTFDLPESNGELPDFEVSPSGELLAITDTETVQVFPLRLPIQRTLPAEPGHIVKMGFDRNAQLAMQLVSSRKEPIRGMKLQLLSLNDEAYASFSGEVQLSHPPSLVEPYIGIVDSEIVATAKFGLPLHGSNPWNGEISTFSVETLNEGNSIPISSPKSFHIGKNGTLYVSSKDGVKSYFSGLADGQSWASPELSMTGGTHKIPVVSELEGNLVLIALEGDCVIVDWAETPETLSRMRLFQSPLTSAAYGGANRFVVCGSEAGEVAVLSVSRDTELVVSRKGHSERINDITWIGPRSFVSASTDGTLRSWTISSRRELILDLELPVRTEPLQLHWSERHKMLFLRCRDCCAIQFLPGLVFSSF